MKKNKGKIVVRVVAIIMAALMLLGVVSMIFNVAFAADELTAINTGSGDLPKWAFIALGAAVVVIVLCAVIPKMKKK